MNPRGVANQISAMLKREGLFTRIHDLRAKYIKAGITPTDASVTVGVYSDEKCIIIVGSVEVFASGAVRCKGDPALCELVKIVPST